MHQLLIEIPFGLITWLSRYFFEPVYLIFRMGAIINHCLVLFALCLLAHVASSAPAEHPEVESSVDLEVRGYRQSMFSLIIAISLL